MAERERKHELVVVVGVRNVDQPHEAPEPASRKLEFRARERHLGELTEVDEEEEREEDNEDDDEQEEEEEEEEDQESNQESEQQQEQVVGEVQTHEQPPSHYYENEQAHQDGQVTQENRRQVHEHLQQRPGPEVVGSLEQQLGLLRDLLRIERHNSEQRRRNNLTMQHYIEQLQADYLRQQSDLVQALEFSAKLKGQKEAQLACVEASLREKEALVEQLRLQLANLDEGKLRQEFERALEKQRQVAQVDQDQVRAQVEAVEVQLGRERERSAQLAQQCQARLDEQLRLHEGELATLRSRLASVQEDLERVLSEPQNLVIKALREDKSQLAGRADELELTVQESQARYELIKRRFDDMSAEQRRLEQGHQEELGGLQGQLAEQRRALQELKLELEDKEEVNQILQFNFGRSEKRVKSLLGSLKAKEESYRELIGALESKHAQEGERTRAELQATERRLAECQGELGKRQNELVRLQLEQENQLESIRNDRDERLRKVVQEKVGLERELRATELRFARELEQARETSKQAEQAQQDLEQMRAESKRLSIELTQSEARLYAKQQEMAQLSLRLEELEQLASAAAATANAGEHQQQMERLGRELDTERNLAKRLKTNLEERTGENERLRVKLRIAETNLEKLSTALNREHTKMVLEHERRLEQIRAEQVAFDRNKLRYKRYGFRLRRYCEHLRRVHEHLCSPPVCGYAISGPGELEAPLASRGDGRVNLWALGGDSDGREEDEDEAEDGYEEIYEEIHETSPSPATLKSQLSCATTKATSITTPTNKPKHSPDKFLIKRTGGSISSGTGCASADSTPAKAKLVSRDTSRQQKYARTPLRPRNTQLDSCTTRARPPNHRSDLPVEPKRPQRPSSRQAENDDRHAYYYIRQDKPQTPSPSAQSRRASATLKPPTPVACRQTKLSLARAKVRQQRQQQGPSVQWAVI